MRQGLTNLSTNSSLGCGGSGVLRSRGSEGLRMKLPSVASLHLRLASTLAEDRDYIDAHQELKAIGPNAELTPAETVERVQLSPLPLRGASSS